jgi:hypothetical protein
MPPIGGTPVDSHRNALFFCINILQNNNQTNELFYSLQSIKSIECPRQLPVGNVFGTEAPVAHRQAASLKPSIRAMLIKHLGETARPPRRALCCSATEWQQSANLVDGPPHRRSIVAVLVIVAIAATTIYTGYLTTRTAYEGAASVGAASFIAELPPCRMTTQ